MVKNDFVEKLTRFVKKQDSAASASPLEDRWIETLHFFLVAALFIERRSR
jgi:hypothetical protein